MHFNWIDWIISVILVYSLVDGWQRGFISLVANLISFLGSLWFAVRYHMVVGNFFAMKFGLTMTWSEVVGYLGVAIVSQLCIELVCAGLIDFVPAKVHTSKINSWLGSIVSLLNTLIVTAFILLLIMALPLRGTVKPDVRASLIGNELIILAQRYGGQATSSVSDIAKNATKFLTIEPGSQESIPLDIPPQSANLAIDVAAEQAMVTLVNKERTSSGIAAVAVDAAITKTAEAKSRDMFVRRYFSHYDPDGKNAADHLTAAGISYTIVGENIAYAPDVTTAHQGFMNSSGHRANILDPRFHRIGIGVIDNGIYGKMFTQEFTD